MFAASNASTRTEHPDQPGAPPVLTQSKEIGASFDPKTGELTLLAQRFDFHYQEGTRQADNSVLASKIKVEDGDDDHDDGDDT